MTLEDRIHIQRLRVLREAERLGNVSEACRRHGMSRTVFYRLRGRLEQYGPDGVMACIRSDARPVEAGRRRWACRRSGVCWRSRWRGRRAGRSGSVTNSLARG